MGKAHFGFFWVRSFFLLPPPPPRPPMLPSFFLSSSFFFLLFFFFFLFLLTDRPAWLGVAEAAAGHDILRVALQLRLRGQASGALVFGLLQLRAQTFVALPVGVWLGAHVLATRRKTLKHK